MRIYELLTPLFEGEQIPSPNEDVLKERLAKRPDLIQFLISSGKEPMESPRVGDPWVRILMKVRAELRVGVPTAVVAVQAEVPTATSSAAEVPTATAVQAEVPTATSTKVEVPTAAVKEDSMLHYINKSKLSTPATAGVLFVSVPVTLKDGQLVKGPTSRYMSHLRYNYRLMDASKGTSISLENFAIYGRDGKVVASKVATVDSFSKAPYAILNFARRPDAGIRKAVMDLISTAPDGTYVLVGAATAQEVVSLNSRGTQSYAVQDAIEVKFVLVPLDEFRANESKKGLYTEEPLAWLKGVLFGKAPQTTAPTVVELHAATDASFEDEDDDDEDNPPAPAPVEPSPSPTPSPTEPETTEPDPAPETAPVEEQEQEELVYPTLTSPLNAAFKARGGAKLQLPEKLGSALVKKYFPRNTYRGAYLTQAEFGAALSAAAGKEEFHPLCCLTAAELRYALKWLAKHFEGVSCNTPEGVVDALTFDGERLVIGERTFLVKDEGVFLPDGRVLNNVLVRIGASPETEEYNRQQVLKEFGLDSLIDEGEEEPEPTAPKLEVVSSFGWFALNLYYVIGELQTRAASVGKQLEKFLPFTNKSGCAGGVADPDRMRWESCYFATFEWQDGPPALSLSITPIEKVEVIDEALLKFNLGPIQNGSLVELRGFGSKTADGRWVLLSNKLTKLIKRVSQQQAVVVALEDAELKRSVIFWNSRSSNLRQPSTNVWSLPVVIAPTLIFSPGAIINLGWKKRIFNHLVFKGQPSYEVCPENTVEVVPPPEGQDTYRQGDVFALVSTPNGQVPLEMPTDCGEFRPEFTWKVNYRCGYPRLEWRLEVTRSESSVKLRGVLKGILTHAEVEVIEGTDAQVLVPADANKSGDGLLAMMDYVAQTCFHPSNEGNEFCRQLKNKLVELNRRLGVEAEDYAVLCPDFFTVYEEMVKEFWSYFGTAKTFVFKCTKEYAEVMMRLRRTEDGTPIKGWHQLTDEELFVTLPDGRRQWRFPGVPRDAMADGDINDPRTNIIGVGTKDGEWFFVQRCFVLDARDEAVVYWPAKGEYSTIRQAVGTTRAMTSQVISAVKKYPSLEKEWLDAGKAGEMTKAEFVEAYYTPADGVEAFDEVRVITGKLSDGVAELPEKIKLVGYDPASQRQAVIILAPHAIARMAGEEKDSLSLPEMMREALATAPDQRYRIIRRMQAVVEATLEGKSFWKGAMGPRGVTGRIMGLAPHPPSSRCG
jgi:hypothetical protein